MPPDDVQRLTNNEVGRQTMQGGADWYGSFCEILDKHGIELDESHRVLDVGVGWGRMLRFLLRDIPVENMAGIDVEPRLVEACHETLPGGTFALVEPRDPLPYADHSFDFVINNSLFSHLSPGQHLHTLEEIARVTRPGGHVVSTILGRRHVLRALINHPKPGRSWTNIEDPQAFLDSFDDGEFMFVPTRTGRMAEYGLAVVPDQWIRVHWPPHLEVIDFDHEAPGQSLVLARKPL